MLKKSLICLIIAAFFSCKPATSDVRNKVTEMTSPVVEKNIEASPSVLENTISNNDSILKPDLHSAKNQICRSLDEIEGFEDFVNYGGNVVNNDSHWISYGFMDDMYILVLEQLSHKSPDGVAYFRVLDIEMVKNSTDNRLVQYTRFQFKENVDNEFISGFVTIKNDTCDQILKSWMIDFENNKLIELDNDEIELTYNWFGYDG